MLRPAAALLALLLAGSASAAAFPAYVNYQGKLGNPAGNPLTGTYSFRFRLYSQATGGTLLATDASYTGANAVAVTNGLYSVQIGSLTAGGLPESAFQGSETWLEIDVSPGTDFTGAETLVPRERLAAVPFAFRAAAAEKLGTGVNIATFTAAGNLVAPSSVTANAFFGDGSHLTGISAPDAVLKTGDTMSGRLTAPDGTFTYGLISSTITASTITATNNVIVTGGGLSISTNAAAPPALDVDYSNAHVGLGAPSSPTYKLYVKSTAGLNNTAKFESAPGQNNVIDLKANGGSSSINSIDNADAGLFGLSMGGITYYDSKYDMLFRDLGTGATRLYIDRTGPVAFGGPTAIGANTGFQVHTSSLVILLNGNVGIGTAAPATKLHMSSGAILVDGTPGAPQLRIGGWEQGNGANPNSAEMWLGNYTGGIGTRLVFEATTSGDFTIQNGHSSGDIVFATGNGAERARLDGGTGGLTMAPVSGGYITAASSVNASAFFGDGSHLTGITAGAGAAVLAATQTFSGANTFTSLYGIHNSTYTSPPVATGTNTNWDGCNVALSTVTMTSTMPGSTIKATLSDTVKMSSSGNYLNGGMLMDGRVPYGGDPAFPISFYDGADALLHTITVMKIWVNVSSGTHSFCYGYGSNVGGTWLTEANKATFLIEEVK